MARLPGPILHTERLALRTPQLKYAEAIYAAVSDPRVHATLATMPEGLDSTVSSIRRWRRLQRQGEAIGYFIHLRRSNVLIGGMAARHIGSSNGHMTTIGYWIGQPYWGKGYMSESLEAFLRHLFRAIGVNRVDAQVMVHNAASIGLLEKFGFQREATMREELRKHGRWVDTYRYGLLSTDPGARRLRANAR